MLTIIIPCLNEEKNIDKIKKNLKLLKNSKSIIVDGNSLDNSKDLYIKHKLHYIITKASRGAQLLLGAKSSKTKWLLFIHADTRLNKLNVSEIESFLSRNKNDHVAYFKLRYNEKDLLAKLIAFWANLRTLLFKLPFGDQGLLITRNYYFSIGGHSNTKIMEDIEFILKIPKKNRTFFKSKISSSFRNYKRNGVLKQGFIHILCQLMYFLKFNKKIIYKIYKI